MSVEQIETEFTVGDILKAIDDGRLSRETKIKLLMNHVDGEPDLNFGLFNFVTVNYGPDKDENGLYIVVESRRPPVEV